ncbi:MAG: toll/interleukin-1 receptor domain-containing protein [Acutalibacteraceae bacterium]|nr:toll/interleukin-1 receptor domain-containing protein [Acutalibacteraceae bacterium]
MQENHDVFISFSFKDQAKAEYIAKTLVNTYKIAYWMCTRDLIGGENFKGTIVDAIDKAKIVVLVQSRFSIASREVPKEVSIALDRNKAVIPFVLDDAELEGDLEYDLIGIHRIDARKPTLDERIEELARQIYAMINKTDDESGWSQRMAHTRLLSTPSVIPKKVFCGRENTLNEMKNHFLNGERVVFLYGIGGIGKTQIVKQYVKQYDSDYDTIVFATFKDSILSMVIDDAVFNLEPNMSRYTMSDGTRESDIDFFLRKLEKIKSITDERTLIVIDNFDVETDEQLSALTEGNYHLIITTRCDYSRYYPTIKVEEIESIEALREIFMLNYGGYDVDEDDELLDELIYLVNKHTYTVELLAQHMENSGQTLPEMISALKKEGILSLNEEVRSSDMKKHVAYENLMKMFRIFTLNDEEKQILLYLSFMPIDGVNVRNFREWADISSCKIIKELENKSWLIKNTEGIALHPVIRDVVKHEIPATKENCIDFINRFTVAIDDKKMWEAKQSDKIRLAQIALEIIGRFPEINKDNEKLYYFTQTLLSFYVDNEKAIVLAKRLYEYNLATYGESDFKTARAAFKCGWVYSVNPYVDNSVDEAIYWLETADKIFEHTQMNSTDDISRHTMTKTTLSKMYMIKFKCTQSMSDYALAKEYAENSIKHAKDNFPKDDYHYAKTGGASMQLSEVLLLGGEAQKALEASDYAKDILMEKFRDENHVDMSLVYFTKTNALFALNNYDEAIVYAQRSADLYEKYFGSNHPRIYAAHLLMGDCYVKKSILSSAVEEYEKALKVAKNIFAPGSKQITEIEDKINAVR